ncbi:hypothetical protein [Peribacillus sp. S4]
MKKPQKVLLISGISAAALFGVGVAPLKSWRTPMSTKRLNS